jgi:hypothetical protein
VSKHRSGRSPDWLKSNEPSLRGGETGGRGGLGSMIDRRMRELILISVLAAGGSCPSPYRAKTPPRRLLPEAGFSMKRGRELKAA